MSFNWFVGVLKCKKGAKKCLVIVRKCRPLVSEMHICFCFLYILLSNFEDLLFFFYFSYCSSNSYNIIALLLIKKE